MITIQRASWSATVAGELNGEIAAGQANKLVALLLSGNIEA